MTDWIWYVLFFLIRFATPLFEKRISRAATRPCPSAVFRSCCQITVRRLSESWARTWFCCSLGKASITLSTDFAAPLVCMVDSTKWPVSAAVSASEMVS